MLELWTRPYFARFVGYLTHGAVSHAAPLYIAQLSVNRPTGDLIGFCVANSKTFLLQTSQLDPRQRITLQSCFL